MFNVRFIQDSDLFWVRFTQVSLYYKLTICDSWTDLWKLLYFPIFAPYWPLQKMDQFRFYKSESSFPKDHACQVWFHFVEEFYMIRLKCHKMKECELRDRMWTERQNVNIWLGLVWVSGFVFILVLICLHSCIDLSSFLYWFVFILVLICLHSCIMFIWK